MDWSPFSYEIADANYFDMNRDPSLGSEALVPFHNGDQVSLSTNSEAVRFLLLPAGP